MEHTHSIATPQLREVKGEMPDSLQRIAKVLDRLEDASKTLENHFERMGQHMPGETDGEGERPIPAGYLGDLSVFLARLEAHASKTEMLCGLAEAIG